LSTATAYFANTYTGSRENFHQACSQAGIDVDHYIHPLLGIDDEELATDVARIGPVDAETVIILTSATHGVEGFGGSGIQVGMLLDKNGPKLPIGTALLLIHGVNPFGFSWCRRVNEDNVDMNRNFVDHAGNNYPENELFELLYPHAVPKRWQESDFLECNKQLDLLANEHGAVPVRKALTKGQYFHPDSVHFGGQKASWSNETLYKICQKELVNAKQGILIDLHTGLGPYGYGELMTPAKPGEAVFDRLFDWFGDEVHSTTAGSSNYAGSKGSVLAGFRPGSDNLEWTSVGLEFGTLDQKTVSHAMRGDIWVYVHGDPQSPLGDDIRTLVRDAFYVDEDKWKQMLWERGREVIERVIEGLPQS
jgi:hypothetical protein